MLNHLKTYFWAGSTTTLFLTKEKREKFTGWAKAYYKFKDKKTNPSKIRKISKYNEGRPVESIVWKPNGKRCSKTNLKDGKGKEFHWHLNGRKRKSRITETDSQTGFSVFGIPMVNWKKTAPM